MLPCKPISLASLNVSLALVRDVICCQILVSFDQNGEGFVNYKNGSPWYGRFGTLNCLVKSAWAVRKGGALSAGWSSAASMAIASPTRTATLCSSRKGLGRMQRPYCAFRVRCQSSASSVCFERLTSASGMANRCMVDESIRVEFVDRQNITVTFENSGVHRTFQVILTQRTASQLGFSQLSLIVT